MRETPQARKVSPSTGSSLVSDSDFIGDSEGLRILARVVARRLVRDRRCGTEDAKDHEIREERNENKRAMAGHQPDMNVQDSAL